MPDAVGVPLIVIVFDAHDAVTPAGKPSVPELPPDMPVAFAVVMVMLGLIAVLIHSVGAEDAAPAVLAGFTVMVPVALTLAHPPVSGIV